MKQGDAAEDRRVELIVEGLVANGIPPEAFGIGEGMLPDFDKLAGERCLHQRHHKGCNVYSRRPFGCRMWNCRWLVNDDTNDLARPDRSHLVIDLVPDYVRLRNNETGHVTNIPCVQVWIDPKFPDGHREPRFRAYVERRAEEGVWCLMRRSPTNGFALVAPCVSEDGQWHEVDGLINPYWRAGIPPDAQESSDAA
jgi:hypothetical protein